MAQNPKPQTVAIVAADAELGATPRGARENAKNAGLKIVYDRNYPPRRPISRRLCARSRRCNPDIVVICSYPLDSVGMVRAINEIGFKPKMIGGAMVGLQATAFKTQLGPLLNGIVNYETWVPVADAAVPGFDGAAEEVSGARGGGGRRPARLLHAGLGLRLSAGARARRSRRPRASKTPCWPTTFARPRSRPWSAT